MQQPIHPADGPLHAKVTLPGSKSMTYRALLLAALADGVSEISSMHLSQNIRIFIKALHQLGIVTQLDEKIRSCIIAGGNGKFPKKQGTIWCANAKTVAKFLLAACAATPGVFYFDGASHLRQHNFSPILNVLSRQGAQFIPNTANKLPFTLMGSDTLEGGEITLDDDITSQLISALLIIAPYARSPFNFNVPDIASQPHIDMTCAMMAEYDVLVHRIHQGQFMVPVPQRYQAKDYTIEPDFGLATYFFAAAAVTHGEITIQSVKYAQSKQADAKLLAILENMGCRVHETHAGLTLSCANELQGIEISLNQFANSFLALAAIAPFAKSPIHISRLGTMSQKESNRLIAIKTELVKLGVHAEAGSDWLKIFPSNPVANHVKTHGDPLIGMALAVIGVRTPGIVIDDAEQVTDFFPDFFTLWQRIVEYKNVSA